MTVSEAIDYLPHHAFDDDLVMIDGERYDLSNEDVELTSHINGDVVDPEQTDLHDGDHLVVVLETDYE